MKKTIKYIALFVSILALCTACGGQGKQDSTPDQVVKEYFGYWANKDKTSMDRLVVEDQQTEDDDPDVTLVTSLKLNSCMEVAEELKEEWDPELYPDPYDFAYVDVDFDIAFEGGESPGYTDGNYQSRFYLIKESKRSEWKIVTWGLG